MKLGTRKILIYTLLSIIIVVIVSGLYLILKPSEHDLFLKARESGDYSLCDKAGTYRYRCVAETELQESLKLDYNCNQDNCSEPECYKNWNFCDMSSCANQPAFFCVVNNTWVCEATGGTVAVPHHNYPNMIDCTCPEGKNYIEGYGCTKCDKFSKEETRRYCLSEGSYFSKINTNK